MVGEMHVVGNAKATTIVVEIVLRVEKKKAHEKKLVEAMAHKKLQESRLTEERSKKNAQEKGTICSFFSCSCNVDNQENVQSCGMESLQQGNKKKS